MGSRNRLRPELLEIFLRVQYASDKMNPEDSDIAVSPEPTEGMPNVEDMPAVNQKAVTDLLERKGFGQPEISKVLNEDWKKKGYVHKEPGRPNKWWLNPDGAIELGEEHNIDVESDRMINRIIGLVEGRGYPERSLSYDDKEEIIQEAKPVLRSYLGQDLKISDSLSQVEIDILWGRLLNCIRLGDDEDPSTWARYNISVGVEKENGEKVLPLANAEEIVEKGR